MSSPFGILVRGGSQHSIWKPRSQESQNSMLSCWRQIISLYMCIASSPPLICHNFKEQAHSLQLWTIQDISQVSEYQTKIKNADICLLNNLFCNLATKLVSSSFNPHSTTHSIFSLISTGTACFAFNTLPSQGFHSNCQLRRELQTGRMT